MSEPIKPEVIKPETNKPSRNISASQIQERLQENKQTAQTQQEAEKKTTPPRKRNRWILPALIIASLGITAFALLRPKGPTATPVNVVAAKTDTLIKTVNGTGTAKAEVSRTLSFTGSGNVTDVDVKVGDEVIKGQPLARLDTTAISRDLEAARANLRSAEADLTRAQASASDTQRDQTRQLQSAQNALASAQAALQTAQRTLGEQKQLYAVGAVSRQALDNAQQTRDDAARKVQAAENDLSYARSKGSESGQAAISQSRAALESAQVRVRNLQANLDDATLRAPTSGVVSAVNVTVGNPPAAGQSAIEITDPERIYLEVPFDETRAADLRVGQPATVQFDAIPNQTLSGTVSRVDPVARASGQVASVNVRIRLPNLRDVKPGFTATATVTTRRLKDAVIVPLETTNEINGKTQVWKVVSDPAQGGKLTGKASPVTITVQDRNANNAAITGLKAGDLLVTPAPTELKTGQAVQYAAPSTPNNKAKP